MTETARNYPAPNLVFSHMGLSVRDIAKMADFYSRVLGFTVTDRGQAAGMDLVFLSRNPMDHHQIVLVTGRPDQMPGNTANAQFGPSINQVSFKMGGLADLRDMHERLVTEKAESVFPANHGIAWSIYAHDPEGNNLEFFVDTDWYFPQPFLIPLDLSLSDDGLYAQTKELSQAQPGFQPYADWRHKIAPKMATFTPA
jgi:catechol 2,3-dioxygenase